jgi:hypothetical protein
LRAPGKKTAPRNARPIISIRLSDRITLETKADGSIAACFDGQAVGLGKFGASAVASAKGLRIGLPLARTADGDIDLLVRRLARRGLV